MFSKCIEIEDGLRALENACREAQTLEEFAKSAEEAYNKFRHGKLEMWNCADVVKLGERLRCIIAEAFLRFERAALGLEDAYISVEALRLRWKVLIILAGSEKAVAMVNDLYGQATQGARINATLLLLCPGDIDGLEAYRLDSPYFDTLMQCALYVGSPLPCHPLRGREVLHDSLEQGLHYYCDRLGNAGYLVDCNGMDDATLAARRLQMNELRDKAATLRRELESTRKSV